MTSHASCSSKPAAMGRPTLKQTRLGMALAAVLAASGCVSLEPALPEINAGIPGDWSQREAAQTENAQPVADIGWRDFFVDEGLKSVIDLALENNRDLRVAVLNVERVRGQYRIQRADRLPSVAAGLSATRAGGDVNRLRGSAGDSYGLEVGVASFELDLFGRVRNLTQAALEQYLAQEEARRAVQLSLVSEIANAYLALAADRELLKLAEATFKTFEESYELSRRRYELGAVSALDLAQAQAEMESARADMARYRGLVAQDINALNLLAGTPVPEALLPSGLDGQVAGLAPVPAGLPSEVLLRRPDVLQAEHLLRAANANIGAARAAYFPSISLTGSIGTASDELSGLFDAGNRIWSFGPRVNVPIFQGGRLEAGVDVATANRDIALAQYERSIQVGFREVADALVLTRTLTAQREAQEAVVEAARRANELSESRYRTGQDSYLVRLDTQRTFYGAQQGLIAVRLAEQANRITLYRVLGGGWKEGDS